MRRAVAHWHRTYDAPLVFYFHTWELDPHQPRIGGLPFHQQVRAYRNLERMPDILREYLETYRVSSIRDHLGLSPTSVPGREPGVATAVGRAPVFARSSDEGMRREAVTLVVPCYNEELVLPYLANALREAGDRLRARWDLQFVFVDDGSTDGTAAALARIFGPLSGVTIVRHPRNLGLAAAIRTGLEHAATEIVCSIDCDCSYDPLELAEMIPLLGAGTALVVASPYHPLGRVRNVPRWRLRLSRTASRLYRLVLGGGPHTFTSCCRVYRRGAIAALALRHPGYLGVAELTGRAVLTGLVVVERPVTLEARLLGRSKMRILRTILGHLVLLTQLGLLRIRNRRAGAAQAKAPSRPATAPESLR
jgi:hypothetical protein